MHGDIDVAAAAVAVVAALFVAVDGVVSGDQLGALGADGWVRSRFGPKKLAAVPAAILLLTLVESCPYFC